MRAAWGRMIRCIALPAGSLPMLRAASIWLLWMLRMAARIDSGHAGGKSAGSGP